MCTGLEIAAVATMVGGAGMQAKGAIDASRASRHAATDFANDQTALLRRQAEANRRAEANIAIEQARQADLRKKAQGITSEAIDRSSRASHDTQIENRIAEKTNKFSSISDLVPINIDLGGSKNAPSIVADAIEASVGKAADFGKQQFGARAAIEALGDVGVAKDIARARSVGNLSTVGGLNTVSSVLAGNEKNFINNLANMTSNQISLASQNANNRLGVKKAKAANANAIGDLLFMAGSAGAPGMGTAAGTPMSGGASGPTQGSGVKGFFTR